MQCNAMHIPVSKNPVNHNRFMFKLTRSHKSDKTLLLTDFLLSLSLFFDGEEFVLLGPMNTPQAHVSWSVHVQSTHVGDLTEGYVI